jgi:hypothetical protein
MPSSSSSQQAGIPGLQAAFHKMARGSQSDPRTVEAVAASINNALINPAIVYSEQLAGALVRSLPHLLQAAGWLHHCFAPGSTLPGPVQNTAQQEWMSCMHVANRLLPLYLDPPGNLEALQSLLEPRRRPQVPGGCTAWWQHFGLLVLVRRAYTLQSGSEGCAPGALQAHCAHACWSIWVLANTW